MTRSVEILRASELSPALARDVSAWFDQEFGPRPNRWRDADYYALLNVDGKPAGRLGILDAKVSVGSEIVRVGGIGGVATKPEFRHRGVASAMLSRAAEFLKDDLAVEFGFLLCRHEVSPVYAKMGWIIVPGPTEFTRAGVRALYPNDTMILRLTAKAWPVGRIDMLGLPW